MPTPHYAHTPPEGDPGRWHLLSDHLNAVAEMAGGFGAAFGGEGEARLAGHLHDLGKYGALFQDRLRGLAGGIDHWSAGAWIALTRYRCVAAALAIQGHHSGLPAADKGSLSCLKPEALSGSHPQGLRLSDADYGRLMESLAGDGVAVEAPASPMIAQPPHGASGMLDVRMLYSALVDADFLDTEAHFRAPRIPGVPLRASEALDVVRRRTTLLNASTGGSPEMQAVRRELWDICQARAGLPVGSYTLAAPTGAGKTLALLGFALAHAARHGLRRVILVAPYLSIIDQTAATCHDLFDALFGPDYVLEHHSLAGTRTEAADAEADESPAGRAARMRQAQLCEAWDAPLVVTTSVQFLESLFANRPGAGRKLHRIADSVVVFDEVQTLPVHLAVPTLAALSRLAERFSVTTVLSTATQPAFGHLDEHVRKLKSAGWAPTEIARRDASLFGKLKRVRVRWPATDERMTWQAVASEMRGDGQAVCITNLKRHAAELAEAIGGGHTDGVFHLSTSMCPAHREAVLAEVRRRLEGNARCLLAATQCVEAGVDLSFPVGYRAFGPLEAIAQAAGRVNRHGKIEQSELIVFRPDVEGALYPPGAYCQAAAVTEYLLRSRGAGWMDIDNPGTFDAYYRELYSIARPAELAGELTNAILAADFPEVSRLYRLIPGGSVNVLAPYRHGMALYDELVLEADNRGISGSWMRKARPLTISLFRPGPSDPVGAYLRPVRVAGRVDAADWFIYWQQEHYHDLLGLVPPAGAAALFA
ncbi:MAG: CRISPR-associated endonuclease Cas3'' [Armatimonadetes bacterium]|nr:CRISPR-associated endonuclease Cas3'' [Armatimonadota bacterium]